MGEVQYGDVYLTLRAVVKAIGFNVILDHKFKVPGSDTISNCISTRHFFRLKLRKVILIFVHFSF